MNRMCKAANYLKTIHGAMDAATRDCTALYQQLSDVDTRLSEFYHEMETARFNVCDGYKRAKALQTILIERRAIKDELYALQSLTATLRNAKLADRLRKAAQTIAKYEEVSAA